MAEGGTDDGSWPFDDLLHAWWVRPGQLLAGEYPGHRDGGRCEEKINVLLDAGIRTIVDLTTPADGLDPYATALGQAGKSRRLDVRRIGFPIPDLGVVDDDVYGEIIAAVEASLERGGVYVQCWGGVGRTGTVVGCLLTDEGLSFDQVVNRMTELRRGTRKSSRPIPEAAAQHDVIRRRVSAR